MCHCVILSRCSLKAIYILLLEVLHHFPQQRYDQTQDFSKCTKHDERSYILCIFTKKNTPFKKIPLTGKFFVLFTRIPIKLVS